MPERFHYHKCISSDFKEGQEFLHLPVKNKSIRINEQTIKHDDNGFDTLKRKCPNVHHY